MDGISSIKCYKEIAGRMKRKKIWPWGNLGKLVGEDNCSDISLRGVCTWMVVGR